MRKGISPVVAVVLLIAIAVIAAIGVWYWVGSYTGKPATGGQQQISLSISDCNGTHVKVRNTGGLDATANATIYDANGGAAGGINLSGTNVLAGAVAWVDVYNTTNDNYNAARNTLLSGTYDVFDANYPDYQFSC